MDGILPEERNILFEIFVENIKSRIFVPAKQSEVL